MPITREERELLRTLAREYMEYASLPVNAEREKKAKLEALIENLKLSLENLGK